MARKDPKKAEKIREYVRKWDNSFRTNNNNYHEMTRFIMGEQWEDDEARLFEDYKKVPLTVNKCAPQMNHLLGEQRQNTPNLQIDPEDDVQEQTAEVRAALIKEISLNSQANVVYQTAFEQAACGGYGAYRIYTDYENDLTFNQFIGLMAFKDPTKCFWDVGAESPCKTDGMVAGFRTTMTRKKFRSLYGKKIERQVGSTTTDITNEDDFAWSFSDENTITVIDCYERKAKHETLRELSNNKSVSEKEFNAMQDMEADDGSIIKIDDEGMPVTVIRERSIVKYSIEHSKWAGDFELESTKFPSKQLPIIFVDQHSYYDKKGKQVTRSFFKDAKDSQRFLNYLRTQAAYLIKISRYDQYMASKQNVRGADTLAAWRAPQTVKGALFYDESPNGNKPEQLKPPELSQSLILQSEMAANDIQATTGMFDTQMGEQGNEISGKAINARVKRGNYNTYIPFDSLNRAIAVGGEIINEMIPSVYDTERKMQLELKDVGKTKVSINKPDDYGMETENDMTQGNYKIRLMPGQSIEGQKQENLESMDRVFAKQPDSFGMIADLYVENLPIANNIEMRNRLRATVPPEIIQAGKTGQPLPPKPPQQDPMVMLKQQELQLKMHDAQMKDQQKQKDLEFKKEQLEMSAHTEGVHYAHEMQKLKMQQEESAATLQAEMLRYQAEMARINADVHLGHSDNIQRILTHQPNHFKAEKPKATEKA